MSYKLFLDDIRFPATSDWTIARNMDDAVWYIENKGMPHFISFDHDLAADHYIIGDGEKTGYTFAKWLTNHVIERNITIPADFDFYVHSMNPVGAANIRNHMTHWLHNRRVGQ